MSYASIEADISIFLLAYYVCSHIRKHKIDEVLAMPEDTGRARGGYARAEKLTPEERREIAANAARERWDRLRAASDLPKATHKGALRIGELTIPCAVLDDGKRVLTESGITNALLGSRSGASKRRKAGEIDGAPLPLFLAPMQLKDFITKDLEDGPLRPVIYQDGNRVVSSFNAEILPAVCEIWLRAREAGALQDQQLDKAKRAEILARGLMHIGIASLVDEATGYQDERSRDALQELLNLYLRREFAAWAKTFPDEFYEHIFRLRGWQWKGRGVNPPQVVAHYTKDLVYHRLAPGLLEELERRNPIEGGRRKTPHTSWLTEDVGHPALAQHLHAVVAIQRVAENGDWDGFMAMMNRALPKRSDTMQMLRAKESDQPGAIETFNDRPIETLPLFAQLSDAPKG